MPRWKLVDNITMNDLTNLELLRLATELTYADYNNRRANLHNQWLIESEKLKKLYGTTVPYPSIPAYPTEQDIVAKAKTLIEFLNTPRLDIDKSIIQASVTQLIADVNQQKKEHVEIQNIEPTKELEKNIVVKEITNGTPDNVSNKQSVSEKPSVINKIKKRVAFKF
jgi:hypothetical protein